MADRDDEARLRDLKKRVEREPRSRFFVPLAEVCRKAGRLPEAIQVLQEGLETHPGYVAARVALARALLEAGRIDESVTAFSKVLADDPSNLVAAKALGDIYLSRGESTEALKRYLRYRAVSGDRRLDDVIAKLRDESGPAPAAALPSNAAPGIAPPPPAEPGEPTLPPLLVSPLPPIELWPAPPSRRETDPFDITSVPFAPSPLPESNAAEPGEAMPSRDVLLDERSPQKSGGPEEIVTRKIRLPEATWPFEAESAAPPKTEAAPPPPAPPAVEPEPSGRALVELYFEQGHYAEAIEGADDLLRARSEDRALRELRRDAAVRLAAPGLAPPPEDHGRERRLAKIRILNQWLDALQARSRP
jgi:tetratricopeptide (TPR) repeat protein